MKRSRLGNGKKSIARGSTFKAQTDGLGRRPITRAVERELKRNNPTARARARRGPGARGWTQRVLALYGRRCVVCGARAVQGHHAVPRQTIVAREGEGTPLEYDARNGVPVCLACHAAHEGASRRIGYWRLPEGVVEWAREHGFEWVLDREQVYPK